MLTLSKRFYGSTKAFLEIKNSDFDWSSSGKNFQKN